MLDLPQRILRGLFPSVLSEVEHAHEPSELCPPSHAVECTPPSGARFMHCPSNEGVAEDRVLFKPHLDPGAGRKSIDEQ
jgi:hypothetical protein